MRGAIAVALVYYYFDPKGMAADSHRSTIIATTLIVVLFSTVVFSAATKPLLEFMLGAGMPTCSPMQRLLFQCSSCQEGGGCRLGQHFSKAWIDCVASGAKQAVQTGN